jgi:hypothetical protein
MLEELTDREILDIKDGYRCAIYTALNYKKEKECLFYLDEYFGVMKEIKHIQRMRN